MLALNPRGDAWAVCQALHNNSQGLPRLDRYLGHLMMSDPNIANKTFGLAMSSYVEHCHHQGMAPRGRVLTALVSIRFRLDAARGNVLNQIHLMNIPLNSYKISDVKLFVERVRMSLANIPVNEIQDRKLMQQWLFERVKGWNAIAYDIQKIRKAKANSRKNTWEYLWAIINGYLSRAHKIRTITTCLPDWPE